MYFCFEKNRTHFIKNVHFHAHLFFFFILYQLSVICLDPLWSIYLIQRINKDRAYVKQGGMQIVMST